MDTKVELTKITSPDQVKAGDKVVLGNSGTTSYLWAEVQKSTRKTIIAKPKDDYHTFEFRMREYYRGSGERLMAWGKGNYYDVFTATTPEQIALVEQAYAARADAKAQKEAERLDQVRKLEEYRDREKREALEANAGLEFKEIGVLGVNRYFAAHIVNKQGHMCFAVVGVHQEEIHDWAPGTFETITKKVWKADLNYAEDRGPEYSIGSMASCSPSNDGKTLDELFENVVARVW